MDFARTGASPTTRTVTPSHGLDSERAALGCATPEASRLESNRTEKIMMTLFVQNDGEFEVAEATDVLACAHELMAYYYRCGEPVLGDPAKTEAFLRLHLGLKDYEVFGLLHLNAAHRLIAMQDLFRGTLTRCRVYAREVVRSVLHHNSAAVVLYHNHPSGDAQPSNADLEITDTVRSALALIEVPVLDHLIVGERVFAFKRAKLL